MDKTMSTEALFHQKTKRDWYCNENPIKTDTVFNGWDYSHSFEDIVFNETGHMARIFLETFEPMPVDADKGEYELSCSVVGEDLPGYLEQDELDTIADLSNSFYETAPIKYDKENDEYIDYDKIKNRLMTKVCRAFTKMLKAENKRYKKS